MENDLNRAATTTTTQEGAATPMKVDANTLPAIPAAGLETPGALDRVGAAVSASDSHPESFPKISSVPQGEINSAQEISSGDATIPPMQTAPQNIETPMRLPTESTTPPAPSLEQGSGVPAEKSAVAEQAPTASPEIKPPTAAEAAPASTITTATTTLNAPAQPAQPQTMPEVPKQEVPKKGSPFSNFLRILGIGGSKEAIVVDKAVHAERENTTS